MKKSFNIISFIKSNKLVRSIFNPLSAKSNVKQSHIIQLIIGLALLVLINIIGSLFYTKIDLTQDKRYSLSKPTISLLKGSDSKTPKLKDLVMVRCYLSGDMPSDYKLLKNSFQDLLKQFRSYNSNIEYEFVDPNSFTTDKEKIDFYQKVMQKGFKPILIKNEQKGKIEQQYIFPYIEVSYQGRTIIKPLISTKTGFTDQEIVHSSIQDLEYTLYSSIKALMQTIKPNIAFLYGQNELDPIYLLDIIQTLSEDYTVDSVSIDGKLDALVARQYDSLDNTKIRFTNKYKCIIVAGASAPFLPKDMYILDQYLMHGGTILWLLDPLTANMDSLQEQARTMAVSNLTGAEDMLFSYGVRLNNDLVMDLQCVQIPLVTGEYGSGQPQLTFYPWNFFPAVSPNDNSIISKKINPLKLQFVSSIDTVQGNNKTIATPLLLSSPNSRVLNAPVEVSLQLLKQKQDPKLFNQGSKMLSVLVEGCFSSKFNNLLPESMSDPRLANKTYSDSTAMIIVSDCDIIKNDLRKGQIVPLGFDVYTNQMFGNKEFIHNCVNYLCSDKDLIVLRSKDIKVRNLDMAKIERTKTFWQIFTCLLPLAILALMAGVIIFVRKRTFASKKKINNKFTK